MINKIQLNEALPKIKKLNNEDDEYEIIDYLDTPTTRRLINGDILIDFKPILNIIKKIENINNE